MVNGNRSDDDVSGSSESSQSENEEEINLMITSRARRKTAGNRYSQVVAQEQADEDEEDEVALLFAEAEGEDEEYNSDEADDEADMSSSDDDDQGPNTGVDDLEGEQEIQKQVKAERQKKRKADMALTTASGIRKKPKIDPTSLHRAPDKPKPMKRRDRYSWLPVDNNGAGRTSLRKQTVAHRESLMERMKESEEQRVKNKAVRDKKHKARQAAAPQALTQADRLLEAARNERRNAKSLNRWEAMEARRAEEQAARLAALQDRRLEGPVITFHSSAHTYRGAAQDYASDAMVLKKRGRKPKMPHDGPQSITPLSDAGVALLPMPGNSTPSTAQGSPGLSVEEVSAKPSSHRTLPLPSKDQTPDVAGGEVAQRPESKVGSQEGFPASETEQPHTSAEADPASQLHKSPEHIKVESTEASSTSPQTQTRTATIVDALNQRIPEPATSSEQATANRPESTLVTEQPTLQAASNIPGTAVQGQDQSDMKLQAPVAPSNAASPSGGLGKPATPAANLGSDLLSQQGSTVPISSQSIAIPTIPSGHVVAGHPSVTLPSIAASRGIDMDNDPTSSISESPLPVEEVVSTRNLVILQGFDGLSTTAAQAFSVLYNTKKSSKPPKHVSVQCPITSLPARYRDPVTGVAYNNMHAHRKLKELQQYRYSWSSLLGCYVGKEDQVARGVPSGFLS